MSKTIEFELAQLFLQDKTMVFCLLKQDILHLSDTVATPE